MIGSGNYVINGIVSGVSVHLLSSVFFKIELSQGCEVFMARKLRFLPVGLSRHIVQRTGALWEGRFKACLVNAPEYLFHLYRYI